ncbi:hypothetical protein C2G38_2033935 [Gigaspora rosea]|uniref:Uncharacterized protein n=1 Tax=Gigaspora rosea TaxID=44941 RepID=A0A397VSC1_9GLOM|nr:hypothetical protein C2G38_2033935 [Gigaspora rosea]
MKNFIFAFILFALLLTVNAAPFKLNKRSTSFVPWGRGYDTLKVSITPDPPVSEKDEKYDVSGTLTRLNITKDKSFLKFMYTGLNYYVIYFYTSTFNESYKVGDPFSVSANVPTPQLPDSYYIFVTVGDPINLLNTYASAFAKVTGSSNFL